jgi:hypothetical protein
VSPDDLLAMTIIAGHEINRDKETQLNGLIMIFDVEGFNMKVASHITPSVAYKAMNIFLVRSTLLIFFYLTVCSIHCNFIISNRHHVPGNWKDFITLIHPGFIVGL